MKSIAPALACLAAAAAFAQPAAEAPVPVRVANLPQHVRERVQFHADQGITSLVHFLRNTHTVYQLRLMDVVAGIDSAGFAVVDVEWIDREIERRFREKERLRAVK